MDSLWFQIIFGLATVYFGWYTIRIIPTLLRLLAALISGKVTWPGPRIHDPDPRASNIRARIGVGYENLFPTFVFNASGLIGAFGFSILTFLSTTPPLSGTILIQSPCLYLIVGLVALAGGKMAIEKGMRLEAMVRTILCDLADQVEPRAVGGQSAESAYAIEHPLILKPSRSPEVARALNVYYESVICHQDGYEMRALELYQEALKADPELHTHALDALTRLAQSCKPEEQGSIAYWLGIHSEYLCDYRQAAIWYEKAIAAFHQIGYQKRESRAHCNLGHVKMQSRDPSGMEEFNKAIALNPKNGTAHMNIGLTYYMVSNPGDERYEWAMDALADAVLADPDTYGPMILSRLRSISFTWKEDMLKIEVRAAKKRAMS